MVDPGYSVARVSFDSAKEMIREVRTEVFVKGQDIPEELEWDGEDDSCFHVLSKDGSGRPIGTARMKPQGKIGRMAVLSSFRGRGVGRSMLLELLSLAREIGLHQVVLDAQMTAIPFYEQNGFRVSGPEFMDAGLLHRRMTLSLR